jgi:glycosyltransferase involved in cell wall biosynthesis
LRFILRVAQIVDSLQIGGAEKLMVVFVSQARLRNVDTTVICLKTGSYTPIPEQLSSLGAEVRTFSSKKALEIKRFRELLKFLREQRFDIVQTHLRTANIIGTLAANIAGIPVINTLHSVRVGPDHNNAGRYHLETWALRYAAKRVIAVGHVVAQAHVKRFPNRMIDIVPNAVEPIETVPYPERQSLRASLLGDPARPLFLSVGRLSPPKSFSDLIAAFGEVVRIQPSAVLAIAGDGVLKEELQQQISHHGLQNSVFLLGLRNDVPRLLSAADFYVSSSRWEGLPLSILEAMSSGLPVVATTVGEIPYVVTTDSGILVPPAEPGLLASALIRILQNTAAAKRMGAAGRDQVLHKYSPSKWMDRLLEIYSQVMKQPALVQAV